MQFTLNVEILEKPSNLKVFGSNKAKWHKHDSLIQLRSHISEQESLSFDNNYIIWSCKIKY
jgi:hypothetical protein